MYKYPNYKKDNINNPQRLIDEKAIYNLFAEIRTGNIDSINKVINEYRLQGSSIV